MCLCVWVCAVDVDLAPNYIFCIVMWKKNHSFARTHTLTHVQKRARLFVNHIIIICLCRIYIYIYIFFIILLSVARFHTALLLPRCVYLVTILHASELLNGSTAYTCKIFGFLTANPVKRILHTYSIIDLFLIILHWKYYIITDLRIIMFTKTNNYLAILLPTIIIIIFTISIN